MKRDKNDMAFWGLISILSILFVVLKWISPLIVEHLFRQNDVALLGRLTGASSGQPLGFYAGMMEDLYFGPLAIFASGIVFLLIILRYRHSLTGWRFALAVLMYLIISRPEVLFYPPYGDSVSGPLAEGIWLYQNSFNYLLLEQQPGFSAGGPKTYLFSIFPGFIALLLTVLPNSEIFLLTCHLMIFAMTGCIAVWVRDIFRKLYDDEEALLLTVIFLALPLVQSQAEQINMEVPLVFFSVCSIFNLVNKRFFWAALFSIFAAMIKVVGILVCAAVFVVCAFLYLFGKEERFKPKVLISGLMALFFVVAHYYASLYILNDNGQAGMMGILQGWKENKKLPVLYLSAVSALLFIKDFFMERSKGTVKSPGEYLNRHYVAFVMFTVLVVWWGLFLQSYGAQYRYRLLLAPFSLFCVYYAVRQHMIPSGALKKALIMAVGIFFLCSYGLVFKKGGVPGAKGRHSLYERSLEYRNDLKLHMRLAEEIEEKFYDFTVGAPFTTAHKLAFYPLGYVERKLNVMVYGFPSTYADIRNFEGLKDLNIARTIWVGFDENVTYPMSQVLKHYPYGPEDRVIREFAYGDKHAVLFMGGTYVERDRIIRSELLKIYLQKKRSF